MRDREHLLIADGADAFADAVLELMGNQTLARTLAQVEIPLGILTAVIGTPFFIWLLASVQKNWS